MRTVSSSVFTFVAVAITGPASPQSGVAKEHLSPESLSRATGYSHVVTTRGGKTAFVSGQVALDKDSNVVGKGDLRAQVQVQVQVQVQKVFENLGLCQKV